MDLAFDIETLGLLDEKPLPEITCVCLYDGTTEHLLQFYKVKPEVRAANTTTLLSLLDSAKRLMGFNSVLFDLEFIKRTFSISQDRMSAWVRKTIDPFMFMKFALNSTSGMDPLLKLNGLPSKNGTGAQAISLALEVHPSDFLLLYRCLLEASKQGKFEKLLDYCLTDAKLTFKLCKLQDIRLGDGDEIVTINHSSGKWSLSEKISKQSKYQPKKNKKKVYPMVEGIVIQDVNMQNALFQEAMIDPLKKGWCQ